MQPLAEGGLKPQVAAKDSAFSVHGVPALPSELKGAPIWELFQRYIPSFNVGLGQLFLCPDFKMRITGVWIFFLPMSPVSIGWTGPINSILNCGETFLRENTNLFAYLHTGTFRIAITRANGLQV